ncbi:acyl carrier protein [Saccharopolyspora antimicrobica]|uniref:Acyl carrier protein n=1 Tax=Saccharopolyspora antimicrobica TaxID=455193 RepID=A0A1I4W2X1_9PSEU|nr:acyl carrier protein [Saccharopolyspora antimicrobica]SFN07805.1 acyl carrier protein [Saccharopolyspora antimicrobica]
MLANVLANVLGSGMTADDISADADLVDEYGLDSLQMIAFLLGIEDTFDVELDYENLRLDHLRSVSEFADFVSNLRAAAQ